MLFKKVFAASLLSLSLMSGPVLASQNPAEETKPYTHEEGEPRFIGPLIKEVGKRVIAGVIADYVKEKFFDKKEGQ